jgi:hypothetical protein
MNKNIDDLKNEVNERMEKLRKNLPEKDYKRLIHCQETAVKCATIIEGEYDFNYVQSTYGECGGKDYVHDVIGVLVSLVGSQFVKLNRVTTTKIEAINELFKVMLQGAVIDKIGELDEKSS